LLHRKLEIGGQLTYCLDTVIKKRPFVLEKTPQILQISMHLLFAYEICDSDNLRSKFLYEDN